MMEHSQWERLRAGHWLGLPLTYEPVMTSTHDEASARLAQHSSRGLLYLADQQTAGHGRNHHHWESVAGKDLLFTFIDLPPTSAEQIPQLTLVAGMAFLEALTHFFPDLPIGLKWPNDLMINQKKLGGLLCSYEPQAERVLISLGLNLNSSSADYSPAVRDRAISLGMATNQRVDREAILIGLLNTYEEKRELYHQAGLEPFLKKWPQVCVHYHKNISIDTGQEKVSGLDAGLDANGFLLIQTDQGLKTMIHGDIQ